MKKREIEARLRELRKETVARNVPDPDRQVMRYRRARQGEEVVYVGFAEALAAMARSATIAFEAAARSATAAVEKLVAALSSVEPVALSEQDLAILDVMQKHGAI